MNAKVVSVAIAIVWTAMPVFEFTMAILSTNIIGGTCVPWGAHSSYVAERVITSLVLCVAYLLPLIWIVFCYARIVHVLRTKVIIVYYAKTTA